jgi:hypothetical protein
MQQAIAARTPLPAMLGLVDRAVAHERK